MNNEIKDLKQDGNGQFENAIKHSIPALVLIVVGGGLLTSNFLDISFDSWWVLFLLMPVTVLFYQVWHDYKRNGRLTSRSIGPLVGGFVLSSMFATFLFDVDWGQLWPVFFIFGGIATLLRKPFAKINLGSHYFNKNESNICTQKEYEKMNKKTLLPLALILLFLLSACNVVRGSGNVQTETRTVSGFDQVSLSGQGELILTQGEQESLEIEAETNIINLIETEVSGNTLHISIKDDNIVNPTKPIKFFVTMREISRLDVSGAGSIAADSLETSMLTLDASGAGTINIDSLSANSLMVDVSGSSSVTVAGQATSQGVVVTGSGSYQAADLESEAVDVEVNDSGEAVVWANQSLNAEANGTGSVNYYGRPIVSQDTSGIGDVKNLGVH